MHIMKGHILAMFTGEAPFEPPVTFPQSHIIYAGSVHQAHEIINEGGYFVVNSKDVQFFKASATPDVHFKNATDRLTPAFSELAFKGEEGCKTFFAKDYRKLRISLGEDGRTTDWILMKQAKLCNGMTATGDVIVNDKKALAGTMTTSKLPGVNNNYEEEKPAEGWRKERKKVRNALKNSPAYIRGRLANPPKKKEPKNSVATQLEGLQAQTVTKVEKVKQIKEEEQVTMKEGRAKCSRYFAFVKKILEAKKKKRAGQREESSELGGVNFEGAQDPLAQVYISSVNRHCHHQCRVIIIFISICARAVFKSKSPPGA